MPKSREVSLIKRRRSWTRHDVILLDMFVLAGKSRLCSPCGEQLQDTCKILQSTCLAIRDLGLGDTLLLQLMFLQVKKEEQWAEDDQWRQERLNHRKQFLRFHMKLTGCSILKAISFTWRKETKSLHFP